MLKKIATVCALGFAALASTTATAAPELPELKNFYYGGSLGKLDQQDASYKTLFGFVGAELNEIFSVELRYGIGLSGDTIRGQWNWLFNNRWASSAFTV